MTVTVKISVFYGSEAILDKLKQLEIPYMEGRICTSFEVVEGTPKWNEIMQLLNDESKSPLRDRRFYFSSIFTPNYTFQELRTAKYHFVRSMFDCVYPDNENEIRKGRCDLGIIMKNRGDYCGQNTPLYQHLEFEGPAIVARRPNWKPKRCFSSGCTQLFCNDLAKNVIEENNLTGIWFEPVLNNHLEPWTDFWRLVPKTVDDFLVPGLHERIRKCPICGADLFERADGIWTIQIDESKLSENLDFFCPPTVLLTAAGMGYSRLIVSQKAYRALSDAQITQALVFDPITCFRSR